MLYGYWFKLSLLRSAAYCTVCAAVLDIVHYA